MKKKQYQVKFNSTEERQRSLWHLNSVMRSTSLANLSRAWMPSVRIRVILFLSCVLDDIDRPRSFINSNMFGWRRNANTRSLYAGTINHTSVSKCSHMVQHSSSGSQLRHHTEHTASNLYQTVPLANSASYPHQDNKWVVPYPEWATA